MLQLPFEMASSTEPYRQHSRSSSDTHVQDLEKGEAKPNEEEDTIEEKVSKSLLLHRISTNPLKRNFHGARNAFPDAFTSVCNSDAHIAARKSIQPK